MSMHDQSNAYRRGVILGLTLAEIMLLILFLLLLTFASALSREKTQHEQKIQLLLKNNKNIEKMNHVIEQNDPSITEELVEAVEQLPYIMNLIKKENLKKDEHESTKQVIERAINKLASERSIELDKSGLSVNDKLQASLNENKALQSEITNLQGQNKNILNQLNSLGKGADLPPCWVDSNGHQEFIFDVYLSSGGIIIKDNKLPNRQSEQSLLPISNITYDKPISQSEFIKQTSDLKKWAASHECHFYVKIYDKIGNNKNLYKTLLSTVENTFYKLLRKN